MKPGYLTTEFWLVVVANVLTQAGALQVPDRYKWAVTAATLVGYAISRGLAKQASSSDPGAELDAEPATVPPNAERFTPTDPATVPPDQGDAGHAVPA